MVDLVKARPASATRLRIVTRVVAPLGDDLLRPSGLRVTRFSILPTIVRPGEANAKQLEDALAIHETTLARSLSLLQDAGVIERASRPEDRLRTMITRAPLMAQREPLVSGD